jgi:hypothetical protein
LNETTVGKTSIAIAVTQPHEQTMTDEEIEGLAGQIVAEVGKRTGVLRGKGGRVPAEIKGSTQHLPMHQAQRCQARTRRGACASNLDDVGVRGGNVPGLSSGPAVITECAADTSTE